VTKQLVVLDADKNQCESLCSLLENERYAVTPLHSIKRLEKYLQDFSCLTVIMDIDTVPVDNRTVRELATNNPDVHFLCKSNDWFHPDLKDAISNHILACVRKPVDSEILFYLLNCISNDSE